MKVKRSVLFAGLMMMGISVQALPPVPKGPYHSLEDERAGIVPSQATAQENVLSDLDKVMPYDSSSFWSWGLPVHSDNNLQQDAAFETTNDRPGIQQRFYPDAPKGRE